MVRLGIGHEKLLQLTKLKSAFRSVRTEANQKDEVLLELLKPGVFQTSYLSNAIMPLVEQVRHYIWQAVSSVPPYRSYYLYMPPVIELADTLPQILSIYALIFYFGSITRYRPHHFDRILRGPYGAFVEGFMNDQPSQLLFLFASEFARRQVSKAALV